MATPLRLMHCSRLSLASSGHHFFHDSHSTFPPANLENLGRRRGNLRGAAFECVQELAQNEVADPRRHGPRRCLLDGNVRLFDPIHSIGRVWKAVLCEPLLKYLRPYLQCGFCVERYWHAFGLRCSQEQFVG